MPNTTEFKLECGRTVRLVAIDQWGTYSGLLEGVPTKEMNERIVSRSLDQAKNRWNQKPYLIPPIETPIDLARKYPFGTPASIPGITCLAHFDCFDAVVDHKMDASALTLVWFQTDFAFPIDDAVRADILMLDWDKNATDYCY